MDGKIREIYKNLICDMQEDDISKVLKLEVLNLIAEGKEKMKETDAAEYCDKAFHIAGAGEEAGFVRGFRYAFELFLEMIK